MPPKRKTTSSTPKPTSSDGPTLPILSTSQPASTPTTHKSSPPQHHTLHPALYKPWSLLPPHLRADVPTTGEGEGKAQNVVALAWSKNQNVRAGVGRVRGFLLGSASTAGEKGAGADGEKEEKDKEGETLAVSAQGEGTTKLIGIMEVARRSVEAPTPVEENKDGGKAVEWFVYTALGSVSVPVPAGSKARKVGKGMRVPADGEGDEGESDDAFEALDKREGRERTEPVLTVWFSRRRMQGFERAFGEVVWRVGV